MKNTIYLVLFFVSYGSLGQTGHEALAEQGVRNNLMSPQTFGFTEEGDQKVSHFTGRAGKSIPVYTYQDKDFIIPITIDYNMSGFMPNQRDGIIGLGWFLNSGGAITRVINGVADDRTGIFSNNLSGVYDGFKSSSSYRLASLLDIFNFVIGSISNWNWSINDYEVDPDVFSFNMPGFSGRFFIQNHEELDGNIKTVGNKPFKVDFTNVSIQSEGSGPVLSSEIVITTDDGYKYYFGSTESDFLRYLEVNYSIDENGNINDKNISSWHINKIVAPNGRLVRYKYRPVSSGVSVDGDDYLLSIHYNRYQNLDSYNYTSNSTFNALSGASTSSSSGVSTEFMTTKTVYLDEIVIEDTQTVLKFNYQEKAQEFYPNYVKATNQKNLKLVEIEIISAGSSQKTFEFHQQFIGSTNQRLFLKSFREVGVGLNAYEFDYYGEGSFLPDPRTGGVDHWGFWNNYTSNNGISIPEMILYDNGNVDITGIERSPSSNANIYERAMLQRITYPTKGTTDYFYEPHYYSKRLERREFENDGITPSRFEPRLYTMPSSPAYPHAGGVRIKKIEDRDGLGNINTRQFRYVKNYTNSGTESTGILLDWPRYLYYWEYDDGAQSSAHLRAKSSSYNRNYTHNENYIHYSEVTEVSFPDNGCITYIFTDYANNGDEYDFNTESMDPFYQTAIDNVDLWNNYVGIKYNDKSFERGFPKEVTVYQKSGITYLPVRKEEVTNFTSAIDYPSAYLVGVHQTGGLAQSFKIYYYPFLPKTKEITIYDDNGSNPVTTITNYQYNNTGYLTSMNHVSSDGSNISQTIKYVDDYSTLDNFSTLTSSNIIKYPIKTVKEHDGKQTSGQISLYSDHGQIRELYEYESNVLKAPSPHNGNILLPLDYVLRESLEYESNSKNLLNVSRSDDVKTSYLWGYNKTFPIAKVINAEHNDEQINEQNVDTYSSYHFYKGGGASVTNYDVLDVGYTQNITISYTYTKDDPDDGEDIDLSFSIIANGQTLNSSVVTITAGDPDGIITGTLTINNVPAGLHDFRANKEYETTIEGDVYFYTRTVIQTFGRTTEVFHENFEEHSQQVSSTTAHTGEYVYQGAYSLNLEKMLVGDYTLTYWSKYGGGDWNKNSTTITVTTSSTNISIGSGSYYLDDIRLHPTDALMTTYSFDPLIGITSQTDPSGRTTYYEYDNYERLERIKDDDGNALKEFKYNYE